MDPEIEYVNPEDAIEAGTRRGHSGFAGAQSAFGRAYESLDLEVERMVDRGDVVGVIVESTVRGRVSGIDIPQRMGFLFTFRDGKLARFEWSNDPEGLVDPAGG